MALCEPRPYLTQENSGSEPFPWMRLIFNDCHLNALAVDPFISPKHPIGTVLDLPYRSSGKTYVSLGQRGLEVECVN